MNAYVLNGYVRLFGPSYRLNEATWTKQDMTLNWFLLTLFRSSLLLFSLFNLSLLFLRLFLFSLPRYSLSFFSPLYPPFFKFFLYLFLTIYIYIYIYTFQLTLLHRIFTSSSIFTPLLIHHLFLLLLLFGPVGWRLENTQTASLQRDKTPPTSVIGMTLNNLMVRLQ